MTLKFVKNQNEIIENNDFISIEKYVDLSHNITPSNSEKRMGKMPILIHIIYSIE